VQAAKKAFPSWSATPIKERVQVFFRYKALLEKHIEELSALVTEENGKVLSEGRAEVLKSAELTEFACSLPQLVSGEVLEVSRGVECRVERYPVGVVASIVPFNFPNMVPNWTLPNALALGNCMILKPSEMVPLSSMRLAEILREAGLPDGVFNIVNGGQATVEAMCDHPDIEAITFVGSTRLQALKALETYVNRTGGIGGRPLSFVVADDSVEPEERPATRAGSDRQGCADHHRALLTGFVLRDRAADRAKWSAHVLLGKRRETGAGRLHALDPLPVRVANRRDRTVLPRARIAPDRLHREHRRRRAGCGTGPGRRGRAAREQVRSDRGARALRFG